MCISVNLVKFLYYVKFVIVQFWFFLSLLHVLTLEQLNLSESEINDVGFN